MSDRFLMQPDRVVISKPGGDATNPSLPDAQKIFDSGWLVSGGIIMLRYIKMIYPDPAGVYSLMFPKDLGYAPSAVAYIADDADSPVSGNEFYDMPGGVTIGNSFEASTVSSSFAEAQGGPQVYHPIRAYSNRIDIPYPARIGGASGQFHFRGGRAQLLIMVTQF